jgi:hypothetical protein
MSAPHSRREGGTHSHTTAAIRRGCSTVTLHHNKIGGAALQSPHTAATRRGRTTFSPPSSNIRGAASIVYSQQQWRRTEPHTADRRAASTSQLTTEKGAAPLLLHTATIRRGPHHSTLQQNKGPLFQQKSEPQQREDPLTLRA